MSAIYYYEPSYHFDRFFENVFGRPQQQSLQSAQSTSSVPPLLRPKMDLHEDEEANVVTATFELPGLTKEDVTIDVHDGRLSISGETKVSSERDENGYAVRERKFGKFSRTLRLPQGVKEEEVKATLENGVLSVTFPKSAPEAAPKRIVIS